MNPPTGQTSLDYLNQISPQSPKRPVFTLNLKSIVLLAIVAIIIVIVLGLVSSSISSSSKTPWQQLSAKLDATEIIVNDSSSKIKDSKLRSLNSDIKLYLTNTKRDLATPLAKIGIEPTKLPESIIASESATPVSDRLEEGRLNAKFDSTYAREMTFQTATILTLLQKLYASSSTQETKDFLNTAYNNLEPTHTSLSDFSALNE